MIVALPYDAHADADAGTDGVDVDVVNDPVLVGTESSFVLLAMTKTTTTTIAVDLVAVDEVGRHDRYRCS